MSIPELWLLAVALAMDCFTVSIVFGVLLRKIEWRTILVVAFLFGLFQAMMPLAGWFATNSFSSLIEDYDHWIAFGLLAFLGQRSELPVGTIRTFVLSLVAKFTIPLPRAYRLVA